MAQSYFDAPLKFRIQKVWRYASLYGVRRTIAKVRSQYHMLRAETFEGSEWHNDSCGSPDHPDRFVGLIGCGSFAHSCIAYYLRQKSPRFLRGCFDSNPARALSLCGDFRGAYAAKDVAAIIQDPSITLVYIASNHASHAEYAIACLNAGKNVHIEKPHVVSSEQLGRLIEAQVSNPASAVYLGFNRPKSRHFAKISSALSANPGPVMVNWFVAGHEIPENHWYFKEAEGGRVLGNLCHWTDLCLQIVGLDNAFPCDIIPASHAGSKSDFCIGIRFHDGSVASITFSAKGHTFEGVREVLQAHKGDAIVSCADFKRTTIEVVEKKSHFTSWHRDHGHRINIVDSFEGVRQNDKSRAVMPDYCAATAQLFLGARQALETQAVVTVGSLGH